MIGMLITYQRFGSPTFRVKAAIYAYLVASGRCLAVFVSTGCQQVAESTHDDQQI
jgi:hypothetical protein